MPHLSRANKLSHCLPLFPMEVAMECISLEEMAVSAWKSGERDGYEAGVIASVTAWHDQVVHVLVVDSDCAVEHVIGVERVSPSTCLPKTIEAKPDRSSLPSRAVRCLCCRHFLKPREFEEGYSRLSRRKCLGQSHVANFNSPRGLSWRLNYEYE